MQNKPVYNFFSDIYAYCERPSIEIVYSPSFR